MTHTPKTDNPEQIRDNQLRHLVADLFFESRGYFDAIHAEHTRAEQGAPNAQGPNLVEPPSWEAHRSLNKLSKKDLLSVISMMCGSAVRAGVCDSFEIRHYREPVIEYGAEGEA